MKTSKLLSLAIAGAFLASCGNGNKSDNNKSGAIGASDAASRDNLPLTDFLQDDYSK